ncbi:MAG TPA: hypothetical protein VEY95_16860 [Azospirillaceae bacterium]|nr:hypothetical protein [Azospirillaceae bacterium]
MTIFIKLVGGRQVFLERARWARPSRWLHIRKDNGEWLVWIGGWHLIYTPAQWAPRGVSIDGRAAPF